MSKYNSYARELASEFAKARKAFEKAATELVNAKKELAAAEQNTPERYHGELANRRAAAKLALERAENEYNLVARYGWNAYNDAAKRIDREIRSAAESASRVRAEDVDQNALALLRSGVMGAADYEGMAAAFAGNNTMLRLIGKYAADAAESTESAVERGRLGAVAAANATAETAIISSWENLMEMAVICSGQRGGSANPDYRLAMLGTWEEMSGEVIDNF